MSEMRASILCCAVLAALAAVTMALAQPSIPATFYGSVTVDGKPAEAGTEVRGLVNGVDCTQAAPGERPVFRQGETAAYVLYVVHETQRPGCARDGSPITFTIAGRPAVQTASWKAGPIALDLSVGSAPPIPLPSATGTIAAAVASAAGDGSTPLPGTATASSAPTGTPPTDDVHFPTTGVGAASAPPRTAVKEDSGSPVLLVAVVGLALLAFAGAGAGLYLSRRRKGPSPDAGA
jgi:hypothetical protein